MERQQLSEEAVGRTLGKPLTLGKSVKRRKSIPRLFLLGRSKSGKSATSSTTSSPTDEPLPILLPNRTRAFSRSSKTTVESSATRPSNDSFSWGEDALKVATSPQIRGGGFSPRDRSISSPSLSPHSPLDLNNQDENGRSSAIGSFRIPNQADQIKRSFTSYDKPPPRFPMPIDAPPRPAPINFSRTLRGRPPSRLHHPQPLSSNAPLRQPFTAFQAHFPETYKDLSPDFPTEIGSARLSDAMMRQKAHVPEQWPRWENLPEEEKGRHSSNSGESTCSSQAESRSTGQSSIFTKGGSVSDLTADSEDDRYLKCASMTVDDAIDLYSAGFEDDQFPLEEGDPMRSPNSAEIQRRSIKIAEAMNDEMSGFMFDPPSPSFGHELRSSFASSTAIMSGEASFLAVPGPPPLQPATETHDQHGFTKASRDVDIKRYAAWHPEYAASQARRTSKWIFFMRDHSLSTHNPTKFPERSAKTQRFIRKGIPPAWRGEAWFFYAGGLEYLQNNPGLYEELVAQSQTSELPIHDREAIERDLHRTFPENVHFKTPTAVEPTSPTGRIETPLVSSLRRVLHAFALNAPRIGYCQSLNFLAGLLLLFLPEEKSFWMLHILTTQHLPGTHEISLEGANVDLWVLMLALKESMPSIWEKVGGEVNTTTTRLPPISLCTTSWFMSLFIGTLPMESVLRVWDILFYEGSCTLFRVAIGIFKLGEQEIRDVSDPIEIFQVVQQLPRKMLDIGTLLDVACNRRGVVGQAWVERKRRERKTWYAKKRALERARKGIGDGRKDSTTENPLPGETKSDTEISRTGSPAEGDGSEPDLPTSGRKRANSGWRGRLGLGVQ